jgi:hypothetical protein
MAMLSNAARSAIIIYYKITFKSALCAEAMPEASNQLCASGTNYTHVDMTGWVRAYFSVNNACSQLATKQHNRS